MLSPGYTIHVAHLIFLSFFFHATFSKIRRS